MKNLNKDLIGKREPFIAIGLQRWRQMAVYDKVLKDYVLPTHRELLLDAFEVAFWIEILLASIRSPVEYSNKQDILIRRRRKLAWN